MRRVVATGLSINTPLADTLDGFITGLYAGKSALTQWKFVKDDRVYSKVGGDLSGYDAKARLSELIETLPEEVARRTRKIFRTAPFSTRLSMLSALMAWQDAKLDYTEDPTRISVLVGGHNLNERYLMENFEVFGGEEPDWIDAQAALLNLDTDHAGSVGEMLGARGAMFSLGGACASANVALRCGIDEIRHHGHDIVVLTGATLDFSPMGLHAMALLGAITFESFNETPELASRPYDTIREGFVPSHGTATIILEDLEHARARGAHIYGEVLGCVATSDGNHLPNPSPEGQAATIRRLLEVCGTAAEEVDFVCAHATSTPIGDLSELTALRDVFGSHTKNLKINAPKSMLGHTCWSAPAVETVAALLQARDGRLHPSINIDTLDPEVDMDVCANAVVDHQTHIFLKNSFGFGGINCCALWRAGQDVA